jgi:hypothetical protein
MAPASFKQGMTAAQRAGQSMGGFNAARLAGH